MQITIKRRPSANGCTISDWYIDGVRVCVGLEDVVRRPDEVKVYGQTAIPAGSYNVIINRSARFSAKAGKDVFLPLLLNLPGRDIHFGSQRIDDCGVRIHPGNFPADTLGCLLPGTTVAPDGKSVQASRIAFGTVYARIQEARAAGKAVTLTIG